MLKRFFFLTLAATCLVVANATAAEDHAEQTHKLIAVLKTPNASLFEKARACQQLGEFGGAEAVPALAALLADEHLGAYARSGLEGIPDRSAAAALRSAATTLKGDRLVGVVNSLGVLRDVPSVGLLTRLAADPASAVAKAALLALGRIGNEESIEFLRQTLTHGLETERAEAAAACLLAAQQREADGRADAAVALYDAVRAADVPQVCRAAATRGVIVARKTDGIPLLLEQLRSSDPRSRNVALFAIREIPSDALADALNNELRQAPPALQIQLLMALVDCHNAQSLQVLQSKAAGEDSELRKTALKVLGRIGGAAESGVLLKAVLDHRSAEETEVALNSLRQMEGAAIDQRIAQALASTSEPQPRIQFIRLLENRGATHAVEPLFKQINDSNAEVGVAALRALRSLAGAGDVPALVAAAKTAQEDSLRRAAENALSGVCARTGNARQGSQAVLAELKQTKDPAAKSSWIRVLVLLGDPEALPSILAALHDDNESVAATATEELARWPNPAPVEDLLAVVHSDANRVIRQRALTSVIQLATTAADEHQRPTETVVQWFQAASQAAQSIEDRRLIISGLGRLPHIESLHLLSSYLDTPGLQNEAAIAVVQIAPALRQSDPAGVKAALEKIAATAKNPDIREKAHKLSDAIPSHQ